MIFWIIDVISQNLWKFDFFNLNFLYNHAFKDDILCIARGLRDVPDTLGLFRTFTTWPLGPQVAGSSTFFGQNDPFWLPFSKVLPLHDNESFCNSKSSFSLRLGLKRSRCNHLKTVTSCEGRAGEIFRYLGCHICARNHGEESHLLRDSCVVIHIPHTWKGVCFLIKHTKSTLFP